MVALEGDGLFRVHLGFFAFEDRPQGEQLREDAAHGPQVDGWGIVAGAEEEVGRTVPDGDDDFVAVEEGLERRAEEAGQAEITDADGAGRCDHDVGRFEVAVQHPIPVKVEESIQELKEDGFDHSCGDRMSCRLGVVVDDLQQVVLAVLEDHEDTFLFEDDLYKMDDVGVG